MTEENTVVKGNHKFLHITINTDNVKEILLYMYTEIDRLGKEIGFLNNKVAEIQNPEQLSKISSRFDEFSYDTNRRIDDFSTTISSLMKRFADHQTAIKDTIDQTNSKINLIHKNNNEKLEQKIDEIETRINDISNENSSSNNSQKIDDMDNEITELKKRVKQLEDMLKNPQKTLSRPVFGRGGTNSKLSNGNLSTKDFNQRRGSTLSSDSSKLSNRSNNNQESDNSRNSTTRQDNQRLSSTKNNKNANSNKNIDHSKQPNNKKNDSTNNDTESINNQNETQQIQSKNAEINQNQSNANDIHNIEGKNSQRSISSTNTLDHSIKNSQRSIGSTNTASQSNDFTNSQRSIGSTNTSQSGQSKPFIGKIPLLQLTNTKDPILLTMPPKPDTGRAKDKKEKEENAIPKFKSDVVHPENRWFIQLAKQNGEIDGELNSLKNIMTRQTYQLASLTQPDSALNTTIERIVNQILENKAKELRTDTQNRIVQDLNDLHNNCETLNEFMNGTKEKIDNYATKDDLLLIANHILQQCNNGSDIYIDGFNNGQQGNTAISTKPCYCLACGRPKTSVSSLSGNARDNYPFYVDSDLQSILSNNPIPGNLTSQSIDTSIYKKGPKTFVPGAKVKVLIGDKNATTGKSFPLPKAVKNNTQPVIKRPTS